MLLEIFKKKKKPNRLKRTGCQWMVPTVVECQKKTLFHNPSKLGNVELHREKQVILLQDF